MIDINQALLKDGLKFVSEIKALHVIYENDKTSTCVKALFLNSQTPKLRFFVLCFGFNQ
jgi:hypothetical protein